MKILVLGSAGRADCRHCASGANEARPVSSRLPGAIAVAGAEPHWLLLNAAPEAVRHAQIQAAARQGHIAGVVLLDARLEHAASLAELCRDAPLNLYATPVVFEELTSRLSALGLPDSGTAVRWHLLPVAGDVRSAEFRVEGIASLRFVAVDDDGSPAPYSPWRQEAVVGESIALHVEDRCGGQRLVCSPGAYSGAQPRAEGADCLLVDGSACPLAAGIEVAFDGMEIEL